MAEQTKLCNRLVSDAKALLEKSDATDDDRRTAAEKLLQAATTLAQRSEAMQLRYLQTLTQIAGDKASTIVFPVPVDVIGPLLGSKKLPG